MDSKPKSIKDFYEETTLSLPEGISREIGHFNVFNTAEVRKRMREKPEMPYNRRAYYKISFISGRNRAEYADKVIHIERYGLLFASPKVPYNYVPEDDEQGGFFCIFTDDFLREVKTGVKLDDLPIFAPGGYPVFQLSDDAREEIEHIFKKIVRELSSDYIYKYDLIRNYVLELIHFGQKQQPLTASYPSHNAATRISSLFIELLERQFPIESTHQRLSLRTAKDYADGLAVHVNHLNKVLRESTGKTTTDLVNGRVLREAKILLRQTEWTVSEIAYCLGFEEVAHFSNFFRKNTSASPLAFRATG